MIIVGDKSVILARLGSFLNVETITIPLKNNLDTIVGQGALRGLDTFRRLSTGTLKDYELVIQTAASELERFEGVRKVGNEYFDTDDGDVTIPDYLIKGVLIEDERTNLCLYSEQLDDGVEWLNDWNGGVTITSNATQAPDGNLTADLLEQIDGVLDANNQAITLSGSTNYTFSLFIKQSDAVRSNFVIYNNDSANTFANVEVIWTDGVPFTYNSNNATNIKYKYITNDWHELEFTFQTTTDTNYSMNILPEVSATATNGIYVWGVQLEEGEISTSYIPTTNSTQLRNKDTLKYSFVDLIKEPEFSMSFTWDGLGQDGTTEHRIISLSDGTANNRLEVYYTATGEIECGLWNAGTQVVQITTTVSAQFNCFNNAAISFEDNSVKFYLNGLKIGEDLSASIPDMRKLRVGSDYQLNRTINGNVKNIVLYDSILTETAAKIVTASIYLQDLDGSILTDERIDPIIAS